MTCPRKVLVLLKRLEKVRWESRDVLVRCRPARNVIVPREKLTSDNHFVEGDTTYSSPGRRPQAAGPTLLPASRSRNSRQQQVLKSDITFRHIIREELGMREKLDKLAKLAKINLDHETFLAKKLELMIGKDGQLSDILLGEFSHFIQPFP
jgi:hypothetical protein